MVRGHSGLYHVALHFPSANDLAEMCARLVARGGRSTSHGSPVALGDVSVRWHRDRDHVRDRGPLRPCHCRRDARSSRHRRTSAGPVEPLAMEPIINAFSTLRPTARWRPEPASDTTIYTLATWRPPPSSTSELDSRPTRPLWACVTSTPEEASCTGSPSTSGKDMERLPRPRCRRPASPAVGPRRQRSAAGGPDQPRARTAFPFVRSSTRSAVLVHDPSGNAVAPM